MSTVHVATPWIASAVVLILGSAGCGGDLSNRVTELEYDVLELREINKQQQAEIEELQEVLEAIGELAIISMRSSSSSGSSRPTNDGGSSTPTTIRCTELDDGSYSLDVALFEDIDALSREGRIVPHVTDGETDGFKLFAVRSDSVYGSCGLQNNDVIRSVSGYSMTSPQQALEAYTALREADELLVQIERDGALQEIRIELVGTN